VSSAVHEAVPAVLHPHRGRVPRPLHHRLREQRHGHLCHSLLPMKKLATYSFQQALEFHL
jgi:hypothetical protein